MAKIEDLSKEELLGLIYHLIPTTHTGNHPCICASCSKGHDENIDDELKPYYYVCDDCEESLSNEDNWKIIKETKLNK